MRPKRNARVLSITYFLTGLYWNMVTVVWQPFVLSLGASMATLGLIEGIGGWRGFITNAVQPLGGWLSDRRGRKPFVALGSMLTVSALAIYTIVSLIKQWQVLILGGIILGFSGLGLPARDSMVAESWESRSRGVAYSTTMFYFFLPGVFTSVLGGLIAETLGYSVVFLLSIALEATSLMVLLLFLSETYPRGKEGLELRELRKSLWRVMLPKRGLRGFYAIMALDMFSWGLGAFLLYGFLKKTYDFSDVQLGIMNGVFSISWAASQLPIGILMDKYGCKRFLIFSEAIGVAFMAALLTLTSFEALALSMVLLGIVPPTWEPASKALLANATSQEDRAEAMGKLAAFRGILSLPAPIVGGILYDAYGFKAPILTSLISITVTMILIYPLIHESKPTYESPQHIA